MSRRTENKELIELVKSNFEYEYTQQETKDKLLAMVLCDISKSLAEISDRMRGDVLQWVAF